MAAVGLAFRLGLVTLPSPAPPPAEEVVPPAPKLMARGQVRPIAQARVATLTGGVVSQLTAEVGRQVEEGQELARVRGPNGIEVLTAPWRGTIMRVPVHLGDTITPGTVVATIGDLSRLQVETTDVDEFLVPHARPSRVVRLTIDALDDHEVRGYVRTVAYEPELNESGDEHYPVVIDLPTQPPGLRPGMNVRIYLAE
jgi:multidrug efflux pump subunit AcrA (membrane-fusion protein)